MTFRNVFKAPKSEVDFCQDTNIESAKYDWSLRSCLVELGVVSRDGVRPWRDSELILRYHAPTKCPDSSPHYHHAVTV
jgi:hypothetical protein